MSRSGYTDDFNDENNYTYLFASVVKRSIKGKRGQAFLREMHDALEALPEKRLVEDDLQTSEGAVCALGAVGQARGLDMSKLTPDYSDQIAKAFKISETLAREIAYVNDDDFNYRDETPEDRYARVLDWVKEQIVEPQGSTT
jgi:hypothetical protein